MLQRAVRLLHGLFPRSEPRWLTSDLALARIERHERWADLHAAGVRAVIDVGAGRRDSGPAVREQGMRYLRASSGDGAAPSAEELQIVTRWALERLDEGQVLVRGDGRRFNEGLVGAAVLVKRGLPAHLAMLALQRAAPDAALSQHQTRVLARFAVAQAGDDRETSALNR